MTSRAKEKKAEVVKELVEAISNAEGVVLVDFRGLSVAESNQLRDRLREQDVEFKVVKNTLVRRAAEQLQIEDADEVFVGPTALALSETDPVPMAKALTGFQRDTGKLEIKAAILGNLLVGGDKVKQLAELPSREELLAKVAGGVAAPLTGFAGAISGLLRNVVFAVDAVRRQREEEAA